MFLPRARVLGYNVGAVFELLPAHAVVARPPISGFNDARDSPAPAPACAAAPLDE